MIHKFFFQSLTIYMCGWHHIKWEHFTYCKLDKRKGAEEKAYASTALSQGHNMKVL